MRYDVPLKYHFKPAQCWMNDPNGLVFFRGEYHVFYQYSPNFEHPWKEPVCWGHAKTKDFLHWEELPLALTPSLPCDAGGCWSGTAIVKDDVLYLFYASVTEPRDQSVSVAYSADGIHFTKYEGNPVIPYAPADGSFDFRDPAIMEWNGSYYLVMASSDPEHTKGRLLLFKSADLFHFDYVGIMAEWDGARFCECPSFMRYGDKFLLTASVAYLDDTTAFRLLYGDFDGNKFTIQTEGMIQMGPDQYAGQVFLDPKGRHIMMSWIPGWSYAGFAETSLGCLSLPYEIAYRDGKLTGYPVAECSGLMKPSDPLVERTATGFRIKREKRDDVVYEGPIDTLEILRDEYVLEIILNRGEKIFAVILC